jgi:hypothetical protein
MTKHLEPKTLRKWRLTRYQRSLIKVRFGLTVGFFHGDRTGDGLNRPADPHDRYAKTHAELDSRFSSCGFMLEIPRDGRRIMKPKP